ncbi:MAG: hypothetical protein DHS20C01_32040 [marine bacterium B5-7]|nr:MAG: hypothetical protein DHS20C01_32040 [marine bacterium B5-7]
MSLRITAFSVILVTVISFISIADADYSAGGFGSQSCQAMLDIAKEQNMSRPVPGNVWQWTRGFLTGMNVARGISVTKKAPVKISNNDLKDRLDLYCQENPDHDLIMAATSIYLQLVRENP